jgi:non-specific serine/threonine protein kinase
MLRRLQPELDNVRAALGWSVSQPDGGGAEVGLRLAGRLWPFWHLGGHISEGRRWLTALLALVPEPGPDHLEAVFADAYLAFLVGDWPVAAARAKEIVERGDGVKVGHGHILMAICAVMQGDESGGLALLEQALAVTADRPGVDARICAGVARFWLGLIATTKGAQARAVSLIEEDLVAVREAGNWYGEGHALAALAWLALAAGDHERAKRLLCESLTVRRALGDLYGLSQSLLLLAWAVSLQGDASRAAALLGVEEELRERLGVAPAVIPVWLEVGEEAVARARWALGRREFATIRAAGRRRDLDAVLDEALTMTDRQGSNTGIVEVKTGLLGLGEHLYIPPLDGLSNP